MIPIEYTVIVADSDSFIQSVNDAIAEGWLPQGGVSLVVQKTGDDKWFVFAQAMIRERAG